MKADCGEMMYRINCLAWELDSIYHQAALKMGMSDSVMFVMYIVYQGKGRCLLHDRRKNTGLSKQTLNSALRKLEKDGIIFLEQSGGKTKTVCFTVKGRDYAANTVGRLFDAECSVFMHWTQEEIDSYMHLTAKYNSDLKRQTEAL